LTTQASTLRHCCQKGLHYVAQLLPQKVATIGLKETKSAIHVRRSNIMRPFRHSFWGYGKLVLFLQRKNKKMFFAGRDACVPA